ncbi:hypothetical protein JYU34_001497, partial [Plutella xylostella]
IASWIETRASCRAARTTTRAPAPRTPTTPGCGWSPRAPAPARPRACSRPRSASASARTTTSPAPTASPPAPSAPGRYRRKNPYP